MAKRKVHTIFDLRKWQPQFWWAIAARESSLVAVSGRGCTVALVTLVSVAWRLRRRRRRDVAGRHSGRQVGGATSGRYARKMDATRAGAHRQQRRDDGQARGVDTHKEGRSSCGTATCRRVGRSNLEAATPLALACCLAHSRSRLPADSRWPVRFVTAV